MDGNSVYFMDIGLLLILSHYRKSMVYLEHLFTTVYLLSKIVLLAQYRVS